MSPSAFDALRYRAVEAPFPGWRLFEVGGRHCERFLHSQLSSDVAGLEAGQAQLSTLLDASGRLHAFFFLGRRQDGFRLLVPEGIADQLGERLEAHVIADDVAIEHRPAESMRLALGPEAVRRAALMPEQDLIRIAGWGSRGFVTWSAEALGFEPLPADALEDLRVLSGQPRWGVEAGPGMLVNETTLVETAVSFSKGCFLGQETVAKVASRRGAARYPVLLRLDGEVELPAGRSGSSFAVDDRARAGVVLSWARWQGDSYLQVSLYRDFRVDGRELLCRFEDGTELAGRVTQLPLVEIPTVERMADTLYHRAVELFSSDREDEAVEHLERAIAIFPGFADAYESLGVIMGRHGRYSEAIDLMRRLLEVDPDSVMAHTNRSVYYNQLGDIEAAEHEAREAAVKGMRRSERDRQQAQAAGHERAAAEADRRRREEMFRQVLELDPGDALASFGMGELCVEEGRYEEAVQHLQKALEADRDYSAAYLALGRAWEGCGSADRAREAYSSGIVVAAKRGDLATANTMQQHLATLDG